MVSRLNVVNLAIFVVPVIVIVFVVLLVVIRAEAKSVAEVGAAAHASLVSSDGEAIGTVNLVHGVGGVLVQVQAEKVAPGGHAFIIHEVGMCAPDFAAAGRHFDPEESEDGFIHPSWKEGDPLGAHDGDLPNIYAARDGIVRADFSPTAYLLTPTAHAQSSMRTGLPSLSMRSLTPMQRRNRKSESESPVG